jgi:hypothetical protein
MKRNYSDQKLPLHSPVLVRLPRNALSTCIIRRGLRLIKTDSEESGDAIEDDPANLATHFRSAKVEL